MKRILRIHRRAGRSHALAVILGLGLAAIGVRTCVGQDVPDRSGASSVRIVQNAPPTAGETQRLLDAPDPKLAAVQRIAKQMHDAQRLLAQSQTAAETQQLQIASLRELETLIEEIQQESGGTPASQDGTGQIAKPPTPSTDSPTTANATGIDSPSKVQAAGARIWGHLPKRLRQRMQSAGVEEFLPQYETMLEAYYRRLANE